MQIEQLLKTSSSLSQSKRTVVNILYSASFVSSKLNDVLKPFGISLQQFNVLRILRGQHDKPIAMAVIQDRMITKMSNTTRLIDKLVAKGYVKKSINRVNRRKKDIVITTEGLNLLEKVDIAIDNTEKEILSSLTKKELTEINRLLGKVRLIAN